MRYIELAWSYQPKDFFLMLKVRQLSEVRERNPFLKVWPLPEVRERNPFQ
jgi:hypothetical protein